MLQANFVHQIVADVSASRLIGDNRIVRVLKIIRVGSFGLLGLFEL